MQPQTACELSPDLPKPLNLSPNTRWPDCHTSITPHGVKPTYRARIPRRHAKSLFVSNKKSSKLHPRVQTPPCPNSRPPRIPTMQLLIIICRCAHARAQYQSFGTGTSSPSIRQTRLPQHKHPEPCNAMPERNNPAAVVPGTKSREQSRKAFFTLHGALRHRIDANRAAVP